MKDIRGRRFRIVLGALLGGFVAFPSSFVLHCLASALFRDGSVGLVLVPIVAYTVGVGGCGLACGWVAHRLEATR